MIENILSKNKYLHLSCEKVEENIKIKFFLAKFPRNHAGGEMANKFEHKLSSQI